jgi:hypothetical protein
MTKKIFIVAALVALYTSAAFAEETITIQRSISPKEYMELSGEAARQRERQQQEEQAMKDRAERARMAEEKRKRDEATLATFLTAFAKYDTARSAVAAELAAGGSSDEARQKLALAASDFIPVASPVVSSWESEHSVLVIQQLIGVATDKTTAANPSRSNGGGGAITYAATPENPVAYLSSQHRSATVTQVINATYLLARAKKEAALAK